MQNKTKDIWNQLAAWWDDAYEEGDIFHRTFLFPTITKWVSAKPGIRILEMGCGNGGLARIFAKEGAEVIANDFSEVFIEKAKERSKDLSIEYSVVDATDPAQLKQLADKHDGFDFVTCSMVLHDMPTIIPLAEALPSLLKPSGKFIFAVPHPCFNSGLVEIEALKEYMEKRQLILSDRYIKPESFEIMSKPGQPVKQICFHRPLSELFGEFFKTGMRMTGFAEPVADISKLPKDFLWSKLSDIPPAIIVQLKVDK